MKNNCEILAPAGSLQCVIAAVRTGADAVYLGTKNFNARRNADNFGDDELKQAIEYCHARGVKVHITLNTLVTDEEIPLAVEAIKHICSLGADVLILQDLGLASLAKKVAPDLERHASTQMSVQTPDGIALLKSLGYSRAVLPREMSKDEIKAIRQSTDLELEMFVHGALCMCVSGQCYMSAMLGGRSGNRGLCAQPCRLPFTLDGGTGHDLSLKDLSLINRLTELRDIGIDSFKIEGRMKRPEYVAAAVKCARASLDNESYTETADALKAVFSRSGFTSDYYDKKLGREMFGTRTKQDVVAASTKVLSSLERLYDKERQNIPVDFFLSICENENPTLTAKANGKTVFVSEDILPEKALNKPLTEQSLVERISKCGGTPFYASSVEIELDENLIIPASAINSLRRKALEELEKALSAVKVTDFTDVNLTEIYNNSDKSLSVSNKAQTENKKIPDFYLRIDSPKQLPENMENVKVIYIPLEIEENYVEYVKNCGVSVGVEIPRGIFGNYDYVENKLKKAKNLGINIAYCSTLDAVAIAKKLGMEIHGGFSLNVFNSFSAQEFERLGVKALTLSPELTLDKLSKIKSAVPKGIIAYGRLPLMLTRNCPIRNAKACSECKRKSSLTDRMGVKFPVMCNMGCSEVYNSRPIYMGDRLNEITGADFITFYFTREKREAVDAVLEAYRKGKSAKGDFTRGLYYRGVE